MMPPLELTKLFVSQAIIARGELSTPALKAPLGIHTDSLPDHALVYAHRDITVKREVSSPALSSAPIPILHSRTTVMGVRGILYLSITTQFQRLRRAVKGRGKWFVAPLNPALMVCDMKHLDGPIRSAKVVTWL